MDVGGIDLLTKIISSGHGRNSKDMNGSDNQEEKGGCNIWSIIKHIKCEYLAYNEYLYKESVKG